jgi:4-hydroxybenzoyl-CoA thioesterase
VTGSGGSRRASVFTLSVPIRFGDCDPAGILYYPRYFDLFHQAMEAWFDGPLGLSYARLLGEDRLGLPTVAAQAQYLAPCTFGEAVGVELAVERLGTSSIVFVYTVRGPDGSERAVGQVTCVVMDLDPARATYRRAVPIPVALRERILGVCG